MWHLEDAMIRKRFALLQRRTDVKYLFWGLGQVFHSNEYFVDWDNVVAIVDNKQAANVSSYHDVDVISQDKLGLFAYDRLVVFSDNKRDEIFEILTDQLGVDARIIVPYQDYIYRDRTYNRYRCEASYRKLWDMMFRLPISTVYDRCNSIVHYIQWRQELFVGSVRVIIEDGTNFSLTNAANNEFDYNKSLDLYLDWFEKYDFSELMKAIKAGKSRFVAINLPVSFENYDFLFEKYRIVSDENEIFGRVVIIDKGEVLSGLEDKSKLSVYVVTHKKVDEVNLPGYKYIQAGTELNGDIGYQKDNEGDNISFLNKHINECTALYWMWKHDKDSDYIGLNHFRRFFQGEDENTIIREEQIKSILKDHDIIVPLCGTSYPGRVIDRLRETVSTEAFEEGYNLVRESILKHRPDYIEAFDQVMSQYWFFHCNMFVTRREIMNSYCQWLFDIIIPVCEKFDVSRYDDYSCRMIGFFAERMLTVWLMKHPYKVKILPILQTDLTVNKMEGYKEPK